MATACAPLRYPNERALRRAPGLESGFNAQGPGTPAGGCRAVIRKKSGSRQRCRICAFVEAELSAKVQAIKGARGKLRPEQQRRPKHLLAGLLRCGCCGSAMVANNLAHAGRRIYLRPPQRRRQLSQRQDL
jgi:Recombinase zinc beta ribbon domain